MVPAPYRRAAEGAGNRGRKDGHVDDHRPGTGGRGQPSTSDTGTADTELLAGSFSALARELEEQDDPDTMLTAIVAAAVAMIPGVEEGSISVVTARRNVGSQAPSGELPLQVDAIQDETRQGPCMDAAYEHLTVRVDDLATEDRWPLFARRASAAGAASMLSLQLYVEGDNLGALNLYARTPMRSPTSRSRWACCLPRTLRSRTPASRKLPSSGRPLSAAT